MDIVLERILSFIPKKPDGKFVHGAKKDFSEKIGLNHPQIISDWIAGRNSSYKNYVYQIAAAYNVSVEWLRGETDQKEKSPGNAEALSAEDIELVKWFRSLPEEKRQAILALAKD